jgi:hypothetical protein
LVGVATGVAVAIDAPDAPPVRFAFVARGDNPVDALGAAPVAGRLDAPVLLTRSDTLTGAARDGLLDADPEVVVVAGGSNAISGDVFEAIVGLLPDAQVRRVEGTDRYETAAALAALVREYDPAFAYQPIDLSLLAETPAPRVIHRPCSPAVFAETGDWNLVRGQTTDPPESFDWAFLGSNGGVCRVAAPAGARLLGATVGGQDVATDAQLACRLEVVDTTAAETIVGDRFGSLVEFTESAGTGVAFAGGRTILEVVAQTPHALDGGDEITLDCRNDGGGDIALLGGTIDLEVDAVPGSSS